MASGNMIAAFVLFALALPTLSRAMEHIVGDELGWTPGFNYTALAQGKEFLVGDTLVFKYTVGEDSVFLVNGPQFQQCALPPMSEAMTTGHDVITLATEGRKWYISGAGYGANCQAGQKLFIMVLPAVHSISPSSSETPALSPQGCDSPSPSTAVDHAHAHAQSPSPAADHAHAHAHAPSPAADHARAHAPSPSPAADHAHAHAPSPAADHAHAHSPSPMAEHSHAHAPSTSPAVDHAHAHAPSPAVDHAHAHSPSPMAEHAHAHALSPSPAVDHAHAHAPSPPTAPHWFFNRFFKY